MTSSVLGAVADPVSASCLSMLPVGVWTTPSHEATNHSSGHSFPNLSNIFLVAAASDLASN